MQRENVVVINPYRIQPIPRRARRKATRERDLGERRVDTELLDLMPFLESIVRLDVKDVREVLESSQAGAGEDGLDFVPEIFRARQTRFQAIAAGAKSGSDRVLAH